MMRTPHGWTASKIPGQFLKRLDSFYDLVITEWDGRFRLYALKYCGTITTIKMGDTVKELADYAKDITEYNWREKIVR
jgi:hypothetical protein